ARAFSERPPETPSGVIRIVLSDDLEVDMPVPEKQIDVSKELQRLTKQFDQVSNLLETTEKKINPAFMERADQDAREKILQKRDDLQVQKAAVAAQLELLQTGSVEKILQKREDLRVQKAAVAAAVAAQLEKLQTGSDPA
ncbi:unnamed protein product, partial [Polarella glacialis]